MLNGRFSVKVVMSLLIVSLLTTSFGGAFATAVWAATPEEEAASVESSGKADNAVVGGILALGVLAAILGGKKSGSSSDAAKAAPSQPIQTTSSTEQIQTNKTTKKPATSTSASSSGVDSSAEQQALNLMNADRAASGLPALKLNNKLTVLARDYAQDMIDRDFFSHYNPEGMSPFDRMQQYGIGYHYAGENLAINRSVEAAEKAFMNSAGHRANILNANYSEIGIGVKYDGSQVYVVQEFIKP